MTDWSREKEYQKSEYSENSNFQRAVNVTEHSHEHLIHILFTLEVRHYLPCLDYLIVVMTHKTYEP